MLLGEIAGEASVIVDPRLDRKFMSPDTVGNKGSAPPVIPERAHRNAALALHEFSRDHRMTIGEDVGRDHDRVAYDPLRRIAAVIDGRRNVGDNKAGAVR